MTWSEGRIAAALARQTFSGHLCCLPNCTWTGDEIDLLVVAPCLRVIDVEIKISRADLKADKDKDKWWRYPQGYWPRDKRDAMRTPREWPRKVWKHYYAMPAEIWRDDLLDHVQPASGVLLLHPPRHGDLVRVQSVKRAQPNRDAVALDASAIMQLARLTSLRMWDAYKRLYPVRVDETEAR